MHVLVVGYGKIGRIKSDLWRALGLEVFVYDADSSKNALILNDGHHLANEMAKSTDRDHLILDISTPAGYHVAGLKTALAMTKSKPTAILIEKPVVSTIRELKSLQEVLEQYAEQGMAEIAYFNESYYSSDAILEIIDKVRGKKERITSIAIELSKNRLSDNDSGRFFDFALGVVGIEMPHMVAILQMFGFDTDILASKSGTLLVDSERDDNQGYKLAYVDNGASVLLETYLGDFRDNAGLIVPNEGITRRMSVATPTTTFEILFDPADCVPRYHARIREINLKGAVSEKVIVDDHLKKHLSYFKSVESLQDVNNFACIENGLKITEALFKLRANAKTFILPEAYSVAEGFSGDNVGSLE